MNIIQPLNENPIFFPIKIEESVSNTAIAVKMARGENTDFYSRKVSST